MSIHEKFAKIRELYPEDIEQIEAEEKRVSALLEQQEFYNLPATQELLALCRKDILTARMRLAIERNMGDALRAELWLIIEAREWFVSMVSKNFDAEMAGIEQQLEADLVS